MHIEKLCLEKTNLLNNKGNKSIFFGNTDIESSHS